LKCTFQNSSSRLAASLIGFLQNFISDVTTTRELELKMKDMEIKKDTKDTVIEEQKAMIMLKSSFEYFGQIYSKELFSISRVKSLARLFTHW